MFKNICPDSPYACLTFPVKCKCGLQNAVIVIVCLFDFKVLQFSSETLHESMPVPKRDAAFWHTGGR